MVEEILKVLVDYTERVKLLDEKGIERIVDIVVSHMGLQNYIKGVEFPYEIKQKKRGVSIADYDTTTNKMNVYIEAFDLYSESQSKYDVLFSGFELVLFQNVLMLKFVLHELGHAFDFKRVDSGESGTIEMELLKVSANIKKIIAQTILGKYDENSDFDLILKYAVMQSENYSQFYYSDPMERVAETRAHQTVTEMLKLIKDRLFNLDEFVKASLLQYQLKPYIHRTGITPCPSEIYLSSVGQREVWKSMNFYDEDASKLLKKVQKECSLDERLKLGLPLTKEEYSELRLRYQRSNKARTRNR